MAEDTDRVNARLHRASRPRHRRKARAVLTKAKVTGAFQTLGIWATVPVYLLVWSIAATRGFDVRLSPFGLLIAITYTAAQVYEIQWRRHILLSADSTAAPAAFLAFVSLSTIGYGSGALSLADVQALGFQSIVGFIAGHICALIVAAVFCGIGECVAWFLPLDKDPHGGA